MCAGLTQAFCCRMSSNSDMEAGALGRTRRLNHTQSSPDESDFPCKQETAESFKNWEGIWEASLFPFKYKVQNN